MNLICPECKKAKKVSTVRITRHDRPIDEAMDMFWDEAGIQHFHNPNYNLEHYKCSNGHSFEELYMPPGCSICDWKPKKP